MANDVNVGIRLILEEMRDMKRELAEDRKQAAEDRKQAAEDRKRAAEDRKEYLRLMARMDRHIERLDGHIERLDGHIVDYKNRERDLHKAIMVIGHVGRKIQEGQKEQTDLLRRILRRLEVNGRNGRHA